MLVQTVYYKVLIEFLNHTVFQHYISLQGDQENYYQHDAAAVNVEASKSNEYYSAKLIQEPKMESKRDLMIEKSDFMKQNKNPYPETSSQEDTFCPTLNGCTCNVTSGTDRLQVFIE